MFSSPARYSAPFSHHKSWKRSKLFHLASFLFCSVLFSRIFFTYLNRWRHHLEDQRASLCSSGWHKACWPKWVTTMWRGLSLKTTPLFSPLVLAGSDQKIRALVARPRGTNLLRNGSELLAVMVRASWAIGEETGFVLPSCSILLGSWFRKASSCKHIHSGYVDGTREERPSGPGYSSQEGLKATKLITMFNYHKVYC